MVRESAPSTPLFPRESLDGAPSRTMTGVDAGESVSTTAGLKRPAEARERGDSTPYKKRWRCRSTAKFREETSKKADSSVKDRVAAMHKLAKSPPGRKRFFAPQQCFFSRQFGIRRKPAC